MSDIEREMILSSTMSVDEFFDILLLRNIIPEKLYNVIVDDVKEIYSDESL